MRNKSTRVSVNLTDDEAARLDEMRGPGVSRSAYLRSLLREPHRTDATHAEAVAILAEMARDGRVGAAVALEKALRPDGVSEAPEGALARLLSDD